MKIVRRVTFNAAHRLYRKDWSDEKNHEVFGLCNNPNYHGHNYVLEVGIDGPIDPETGFIIDVKILKEIIHNEVADRYDHKNLNLDCPEFHDLNPTVENIALICYQRLNPHLTSYGKLSLKLFETEKNWVEYDGV
jgi:6-pyruvoyltetrahydropterin/6-carboxytetrahydropterin synthase